MTPNRPENTELFVFLRKIRSNEAVVASARSFSEHGDGTHTCRHIFAY